MTDDRDLALQRVLALAEQMTRDGDVRDHDAADRIRAAVTGRSGDPDAEDDSWLERAEASRAAWVSLSEWQRDELLLEFRCDGSRGVES